MYCESMFQIKPNFLTYCANIFLNFQRGPLFLCVHFDLLLAQHMRDFTFRTDFMKMKCALNVHGICDHPKGYFLVALVTRYLVLLAWNSLYLLNNSCLWASCILTSCILTACILTSYYNKEILMKEYDVIIFYSVSPCSLLGKHARSCS